MPSTRADELSRRASALWQPCAVPTATILTGISEQCAPKSASLTAGVNQPGSQTQFPTFVSVHLPCPEHITPMHRLSSLEGMPVGAADGDAVGESDGCEVAAWIGCTHTEYITGYNC